MRMLRPLVLLLLLVFAGCAKTFQPVPAPVWQLKDVDGNTVSSEQFKGKIVVVDFWATWCVPCREEMPGYVALQKKYAKDGVVIIGISMDQAGPEVVKEFIQKTGVNYQIVIGDDAIAEAFGVNDSLPTTFIIDRTGMVRDRKIQVEPTAAFEKRLLRFLR